MNERVELHCHTKMSQMAGLIRERGIINETRLLGMSAVAVTDINSVQGIAPALSIRSFGRCEEDDSCKLLFGIEAEIVNDQKDDVNGKKEASYGVIIISKTREGVRNLYRIISEACLDSVYKKIPRCLFEENREGLIIGSCAENGEVARALFEKRPGSDIKHVAEFYDFIEVGPVENYIYPLYRFPELEKISREEVEKHIKSIIKIGKEVSVPVIASANVYYLKKADLDAFKVLRYTGGHNDPRGWKPKHHFMSSSEMMDEFNFLGEKTAKRIVIDNPNRIAEGIDALKPFSDERKSPVYPKADQVLRKICLERVHEIYGERIPDEVKKRLDLELKMIKKNGYASYFMICHELVKKSNDAGYLVGNRGTAGSSFVCYLAGITDINPLPAHYLCRKCGYTDFSVSDTKGYYPGLVGMDLPDRKCPVCGKKMSKDGYDLPPETFYGFHFDKEPDIDFNFSGDYQLEIQKYLTEIKGIDAICRPGTIETMSEIDAIKIVHRYFEYRKKNVKTESILKVAEKITAVKIGNGVHPGGIIVFPKGTCQYDYTPILPWNGKDIPRSQIEYHYLDHVLLKIDILGHNTPTILRYMADRTGVDPRNVRMDDKGVMSLFSGIGALGLDPKDIGGVTVGTLGVPEFGSKGIRWLIEQIRPKRFSDIIKILSMMHGTDTWYGNAEKIIEEKTEDFSSCIASRDDIMLYLISKGIDREEAYTIMESVRKGKGIDRFTEWREDMQKAGVPEWYIDSCNKIRYLFPKAHSAHYALSSWRILYYKLHYPEAFYSSWLEYTARVISRKDIEKGYDYAKEKYDDLLKKSKRMGSKQKDLMEDLLVVMEMHSRGVHLK